MGAVRRLRPSETGAGPDDNELETFESESQASAPQQAPAPALMVSVPAYPPRESHPTSSARLSPPPAGDMPVAVVRPRFMASVRRRLRAVALAPVRLCALGCRAIGRVVHAVVVFAGRTVAGAAHAVVAFARAVTRRVFGVVAGAARLLVEGVKALGQGVVAALAFVAHGIVHAIDASLAMVRRTVTRAALAVVALARAVTRGIFGAAAATIRSSVGGVKALGHGVSARFALILNGIAHAIDVGLAVGRRTVARVALAVAALARAIARSIFDAAAATVRSSVDGVKAMRHTAAVAFAFAGPRLALMARTTASLAWTMARRLARSAAAHVTAATRAGLDAWQRGAPAWRRLQLQVPMVAVAAVAVVVAVVTAGGVMRLSPQPVAQPVAAAVRVEVPPPAALAPVAAVVTPRPEAPARRATRRPTPKAAPVRPAIVRPAIDRASAPGNARIATAPRADRALNAETVRAIWLKTDTRSLDRGLSAVRSATLALHRCNVQLTSADRAVARCDVRPADEDDVQPRRGNASWTIDFRRADERWLIDQISAAAR